MELLDPAPDFSAPLAALSACHRRLLARLETLLRLGTHLLRSGADEDARQAAGNVLAYFRQSAPNHHLDEESSLFPRLLREARSDTEREKAFELVSRLMVDHLMFDRSWETIEAELVSVTLGEVPSFDPMVWWRFVDAYRRHIELEEKKLFPFAHYLLSAATFQEIGREMEQRRSLPTA
jgi:hemerythrin-like domain-containing protein